MQFQTPTQVQHQHTSSDNRHINLTIRTKGHTQRLFYSPNTRANTNAFQAHDFACLETNVLNASPRNTYMAASISFPMVMLLEQSHHGMVSQICNLDRSVRHWESQNPATGQVFILLEFRSETQLFVRIVSTISMYDNCFISLFFGTGKPFRRIHPYQNPNMQEQSRHSHVAETSRPMHQNPKS